MLLTRLGDDGAVAALATLDSLYPQTSGAFVRAELVERLAAAAPGDLGQVELRDYKALLAPWNDWKHVASVGQRLAGVLSAALLEEQS